MRHHFYKNESYDFAFEKRLVGLKQNNSDFFCQTRTIFLN